MKVRMKKITSLCAAVFTAAALTVGGAGIVYGTENTEEETVETAEDMETAEESAEAEEADEDAADDTVEEESEISEEEEETDAGVTLMQYVQQMTKSLTDSLIVMTDEDIEGYKASTDAFTVEAVTAWESAKSDVGERVDSETDDTDSIEVVIEDGVYTATYSVDFDKADAVFVFQYDQNLTPTSATVDVDIPLSTTLKNAGLNTIMGVGIVFLVLVFLSFLISLFKYIPDPEKKKKEAEKKAAEEKKAAAAAAVPAVEEEEYADDEELVAVIMAAIAASEGTSTDGFVVRSIRKARRAR